MRAAATANHSYQTAERGVDSMICKSCGADVKIEAVYCHKCGERLDAGQVMDVSPETPGEGPPEESPEEPESPKQTFESKMAPRGGSAEEEEEGLWEGGYSPKAMIGTWILAGIGSVLALILGIWLIGWIDAGFTGWLVLLGLILLAWCMMLVQLWYRRASVRYELSNQRFIHQSGILRRVTDRIEVIDMDDITFEQGLVERMVGVGTIIITSSDRSHPKLRLEGIEEVKEVSETIDNARRKERLRRGIHIEQV